MIEIICSGFGGQGILVAGMILADAGIAYGDLTEQERIATDYVYSMLQDENIPKKIKI